MLEAIIHNLLIISEILYGEVKVKGYEILAFLQFADRICII